jgi:phosphopentomutase
VVAVTGPLAGTARAIARALAACAGITRLVAGERGASAIARRALDEWYGLRDGVLFAYLPDCDQAGHAAGWMSPSYLGAALAVDAAAGELLAAAEPDALTIVLADHGGGGVTDTDHDAPHPVNDAIPLLLAGGGVRAGAGLGAASLLDVPATLLHWFGVPVPECYEGRPLAEAFAAVAESVA